MKILMITPYCIDESDAPSTHIRELGHNLSKHHEVRVIAQSKKNLDEINIDSICRWIE